MLPLDVFAQPDPALVKKFTVTPAAEPRPALKYSLLPTLREKTPGNAALAYHRAFTTRPTAKIGDEAKQNETATTKFEGSAIQKINASKLEQHLQPYSTLFQELDKASHCDRCEWELLPPRGSNDGMGVIFQQIGPAREAIQYLGLKVKLELKQNHYIEAAKWLTVGFQTAKHHGEAGALIQMLVGLAMENTLLERVEDWIARPDSPNLYWALTALPRPLIDSRIAFEGEAVYFDSAVPENFIIGKKPMTAVLANRILDERLAKAKDPEKQLLGPDPDLTKLSKFVAKTDRAGYTKFHFANATKDLLARGHTAKELDAMPQAQVLLLQGYEHFKELLDDQRKYLGLPYPDAEVGLKRCLEKQKKMHADNETDAVLAFYMLTLPAMEKVFIAAGARSERKVAALRVIEAIRLHSATTNGQLPATLSDITIVPVPDDPIRNKPFNYICTGNTFTLSAPVPFGDESSRYNVCSYAITLKAK